MDWLPNWHWFNLLIIPGLIIGFTIHELGHALMAYFLGDYSQVKEGRITANPFRHISWLGATLFIFFGIGWPKPLSFNPKNFKNRYLDSFLVAVAGPFANFALCLIIFLTMVLLLVFLNLTRQVSSEQVADILFFRRTPALNALSFGEAAQDVYLWVVAFSNRIWVANFVLAMVSLIPLPPFDGFTALLSLVGLVREKRIHDLAEEETASSPMIMASVDPQETTDKKQSMADIHFKLGTEYHQQQRFDDAIARYRQALSIDSTYGPAYVNMGLVYRARNQRSEAISAFRAATRYAADEKSKNQAWSELHTLSALPNNTATGQSDAGHPPGETPWTDINPSPDWLGFGAGAVAFLLIFVCIFSILLLSLIGS